MNTAIAFQDQLQHNHCFGCGAHNAGGLRIKSHWSDENASGESEAICRFTPQPHHCSGPTRYVNGGIVSTIIDCHCVCTAMAKAYAMAGRAIGTGDEMMFVTGRLEVNYKKPVPMEREILVKATITEIGARKMVVLCDVWSGADLCVEGRVIAVNVGNAWSESC